MEIGSNTNMPHINWYSRLNKALGISENLDDKDEFGMSDEDFGRMVRNIGPEGGYVSFSGVALYSYEDFIHAFRARGWTVEEIKRDQWWANPPVKH